ncbi:MAG: hypothetical protein K9K40_12355 [Desulfotignum sp.]|nr:hypothetical protein [Desulfotignum sp.]
MDMKKLAPWNWFKKENENMGKTVPVRRGDGLHEDLRTGTPLQAFHREVDRLFADMFQGFGVPSAFGRKDLLMSGRLKSGQSDGWNRKDVLLIRIFKKNNSKVLT